jgi:hypothetical protein
MPRDFQLSKLLEALPIKLEDLSDVFRKYDTAYIVPDKWPTGYVEEYYPLPAKGDYMILLLQAGSGCGQSWTTIRSQWGKSGNKLEYYRGLVGQVVECKITE